MNGFQISVLVLPLFIIVSGCSGGGRDLGGGGNHCHIRSMEGLEAIAPDTQIIDQFSKSTNDGSAEDIISASNLPQGIYELTISDYLYVRKIDPSNPRRWMMTQIRQEIDFNKIEAIKRKTGQDPGTIYRTYNYCVGGYDLGDASYQTEVSGFSKINVLAQDKVEFETTSWGYNFDGKRDMIESLWLEVDPETGVEKPSWRKVEGTAKYSAPKEVFGEKLERLSLRKLNSPNEELYQIFSLIDVDGGTTYKIYLATFKRHPLPEAAIDESQITKAE